MKIFLSWSGERSKRVAKLLHAWIPMLVPDADPWLSERDIGAGARWAIDLAKKLEGSDFGIICLTPENQKEPWILFEAGALSKSIEHARVCPYLFDMDLQDLLVPLSQFQAKKADRESTRDLIGAIEEKSTVPRTKAHSDKLFDLAWPEFAADLAKIEADTPAPTPSRVEREVLEELVTVVRSLEHRILSLGTASTATGASRRVAVTVVAEDPIGALKHGALLRFKVTSASGLVDAVAEKAELDVAQFGEEWFLMDEEKNKVFHETNHLGEWLQNSPGKLLLSTFPF